MKSMAAFFLIVFFHNNLLYSQLTIKGKVVAGETGLPVPGSSVFISNTSKGTTAAKDGSFEITNVPVGKYELVVSSVGYETNVFSFSSEQLPLLLRVEMQIKVRELQNVTVEPSVEEGWDRWGKTFTDNFIGNTPNAAHCKIKNQKAIRFRYFKKSNRVIAYADEPIILENKALGYLLSYQLEDFEVNFNTRATFFAGYPLFEEMEKNSRARQQKWAKNRDKAYYGSMLHFMYSLYHDSLLAQGFEVRRMQRVPNTEKERVKKIMQAGRVVRNITGRIEVIDRVRDSLRKSAPDTLDYYERVLGQDDYKEVYGREFITLDSVLVQKDGNYKSIYFDDYLFVTYKKELEEDDYIVFHHERRSRTYQRSYLNLPNKQAVIVDVNGNYYPPQEVYSMAYWGWSEKMADFLPIDYQPATRPD